LHLVGEFSLRTGVVGAHGEMRPFIAFIHKQSGADFRVSFPDFPDCVSSGRTVGEARTNAERALALHCWTLHHAGTPLPQPLFMHEIDATRTEGLVALIVPPNVHA
jgi:predicted RNase H-like HicB family nuclease